MGVRFPFLATTTIQNALPASALETVVLISPPFSPSLDLAQVGIMWSFTYTAGATNSGATYRLRRGTTTAGTLLWAPNAIWQVVMSGGNPGMAGGCYVDSPGAVAGVQYCLTCAQVGATGAGTFPDGCLMLFAL